MPDFPLIDSHVHLCDPQRFSYDWAKNNPKLNRNTTPTDLLRAARPVEIEQFVFVEADVTFPGHIEEAFWIEDLARLEPRLTGLVAALPLEAGKAIELDLERLLQGTTIVRGIRRLIQAQPDPNFCIMPGFIEGLKLLPRYDLAFDICIFHYQMPNAIKMVRKCPEVRFVLDHIGKPGIKSRLFNPWRKHLSELASMPNVVCKLSGVTIEADREHWTRDDIEPYIDHAIETFGFDRILYASDWHVMELAGSYPEWVSIIDSIIGGCSLEEKRKLFRDNAIDTYRLKKWSTEQ